MKYTSIITGPFRSLALLSAFASAIGAHAQSSSDACGFAVANQYTVNSSCTFQTFNKPTAYVNNTNPGGCNSSANDDAFGWFTATSTLTAITYDPLNNHDPVLHVLSGTCGSPTVIGCADNGGNGVNETVTVATTIGANYHFRVQRYSTNSAMDGSICIYTVVPPANDEPCGATALTLGTTCSSTSYTNVNATFTSSMPDPDCGGYSGSVRDVWFSFVAPGTRTVHVEVTVGTLANPAMALYAATACGGTYSLIECDDNDGIGNAPFLYFYDLVPGDTYYLRVWGSGGGQGTFNLCAVTPATTTDCFYALHLNDSYGDGWDGSTVGVSINGGATTNYTLSDGNKGMVYIPMDNGDIITLTYTAAGSWQNEISYVLQSGQGILFSDGPTPASGTVYANANDCVAPDPPREDCYGSLAICAASGNSSNPASTGLRSDLNLHTRGCLSNDERQGTWFNFTVSASGTIEFTIVPSNSGDDYDFALWGPETSVACPPSTSPYRCSYSDDSGNTGLLVSSTDVSEDANGDKYVQAIDVSVGEVYVLYISNWSQSGLQFDLDFNMISGASIDCTALPVELLTFEADASDRTVKLDWATASEAGSAHFVVQRSTDGENFVSIGQVAGAGTSFTTIEYGFEDPQPIVGTNYYRLKQVDTDGSFSYSEVAAVNFGSTVVAGTPFPNPTDGTVNVLVNANIDGQVQLAVTDASGRTVHQEAQALMRGTNTVGLELQGLKPGTYMLTLWGEDGTPTRCGRFVLR